METLEQMLDNLYDSLLEDKDIREMFERNFPDLSYEDTLTITLAELYELAMLKSLSPQELSIQGVKLFFANVLTEAEEDNSDLVEELTTSKEDDGYGEA
jgi:hypothetical protein